MFEAIIINIISSFIFWCLGKAVNNARNKVADRRKDRATTVGKLREKIIEDLHDIDGPSRKDLLASFSFLEEGVVTLNLALDEAQNEQIYKDGANGAQNDGSETTATTRSKNEYPDLNEAIALSAAIQNLNNTSNVRFVSAKKCFKTAREEATRVFCNEALNLPDRIMAAKLRVVSKILECLQDTKVAAAVCMLFLKDLHNLPAIGQTFSTYFKGGIKSQVYKDWRLKNVKSVLSLNFAISEFIARFSGGLPDVRNWPRIHLPTRGETIHPLLFDISVVKENFDKEEFQMPENQVISTKLNLWRYCTNSKGQLLAVSIGCNTHVNLFDRSGPGYMKTFCQIRHATANLEGNDQYVKALAIDRKDNVFVIICFQDCTSNRCVYVLFVFDSSGNEQCERVLDFIEYKKWKPINCVVDNDGDIIIHVKRDDHLYVCERNGSLKSCLSLEQNSNYHSGDFIHLECVTDQNGIVMHTDESENVFVYTKEGKLKRTIKVKDKVRGVTYNYATSKIEILVEKQSIFGTRTTCCILSYSENDEVECLYLPVNRAIWSARLYSHPAGPAAFGHSAVGQCKVVFM